MVNIVIRYYRMSDSDCLTPNLIDPQEADCEVGLRVLLIGGGGDTDTFIGHGGGSGFIKLQEVSDTARKEK